MSCWSTDGSLEPCVPTWRLRVKAVVFVAVGLLLAATLSASQTKNRRDPLAASIRSDPDLAAVTSKAETVVHNSLNAGDNYHEVWIRDLNTFLQFDLQLAAPPCPYAPRDWSSFRGKQKTAESRTITAS